MSGELAALEKIANQLERIADVLDKGSIWTRKGD